MTRTGAILRFAATTTLLGWRGARCDGGAGAIGHP